MTHFYTLDFFFYQPPPPGQTDVYLILETFCFYLILIQGHPEAWSDTDGPPEEDYDQRPADESAGPQQERAVCARITPTLRFPSAEMWKPSLTQGLKGQRGI